MSAPAPTSSAAERARVLHIFVAPTRGAPMERRDSVRALTDEGLAGDRYANAGIRRTPHHGVTLIEAEHIDAFAKATGCALRSDMPRRNIVTSGVRLNPLVGQRFTIGAVTFEGLELCEPCRLFAKRSFPEVLTYFVGKGGLRARIVAGGEIRVGDVLRSSGAPA